MKKGGKLSRWLSTPGRALSRACDFYVRGMSGCARRVPLQAAAVGRNFGRSKTSLQYTAVFGSGPSMRRDTSDCDDLIRAASRQRRVVADPGAAATQAAVPLSRKQDAPMGTIDEDTPCVFEDGARASPALPRVPRSCGVVAGGLAARAGGFGALKTGGQVFAK